MLVSENIKSIKGYIKMLSMIIKSRLYLMNSNQGLQGVISLKIMSESNESNINRVKYDASRVNEEVDSFMNQNEIN